MPLSYARRCLEANAAEAAAQAARGKGKSAQNARAFPEKAQAKKVRGTGVEPVTFGFVVFCSGYGILWLPTKGPLHTT